MADGIHVAGYGQLCASTSYESNVPFVLRFMVGYLSRGEVGTSLCKFLVSKRDTKLEKTRNGVHLLGCT